MIMTLFYIILTFILSSAIWMGIVTFIVRKISKRIDNLQEIIQYMAKNPGRPIKKHIKK